MAFKFKCSRDVERQHRRGVGVELDHFRNTMKSVRVLGRCIIHSFIDMNPIKQRHLQSWLELRSETGLISVLQAQVSRRIMCKEYIDLCRISGNHRVI